jgi:hypothetical protein
MPFAFEHGFVLVQAVGLGHWRLPRLTVVGWGQ